MKRLNTALLSCLLGSVFSVATVSSVRAQGIEFVHDLDSALMLAKAQNKPVFIDFYTSWCAPCKVMTKNVFPQKSVGDYFNKQFINCKIQCDDNGKGVEVGNQYQVTAYPTLMFLDKDGKMMHSTAGGMSAAQLIDLASVAFDPKHNLASLINEWEGGRRDTAFVRHYLATLKSSYRFGLASRGFEDYLRGLDTEQKISAFTFDMLKLIGYAPGSEPFVFLEKNRKQFQKSAGSKRVDEYIQRAYEGMLRNMALEKGGKARKEYEAFKAGFASSKYEFKDQVLMFTAVFETFDTTGRVDIVEYQKRGTAFLKKYGTTYDGYTLGLSSLLGNCTGKENEGEAAITWMEELIARNPKPSYYSTYFYVIWRNRQWDKALEVGRQMRERAISNNESTKTIDEQIAMVAENKEKYKKATEKSPAGIK